MKRDVAANVVEIAYEEVEFFVELLDLSPDGFPDWLSFFKAIVDSLFKGSESLIEHCDVLRHRHLLEANLGDFAAKRSKFSQYSPLKRTGPREFFCEIFTHVPSY